MQIDLNVLYRDAEVLEDVFDLIAIELRKYEESIPWEEAKKQTGNPESWCSITIE